jgi:hypothetical protein
MITSKRARTIAAIIAFAYIFVQSFQSYVFSVLPPTNSPTDEFLQGSLSINLWRATVLLIAFWGLLYVFLIVCVQNLKSNFTATVFAFLGFLIFCLLEICLRSVELFYFQIHLPAVYRQTVSVTEQKAITDSVANFQSIQLALYFPLMLSQMIGSIVLAATFERNVRLNYLIILALALNGLRLVLRIFGMFLHINWLDNFSNGLYLPFVLVVFALIGIWLLLIKEEVSLDFDTTRGK